MKKFFTFTRRKSGRSRGESHHRRSTGSFSDTSNKSLVIHLIRGAYNIDLAKVDQSFTKLHKACFLNYDLNKIKKYLKQGINPNQLDNVSRSSPLHLATVNGNLNIIRVLIENGANIDLPDGDGKTPVIKAIECFHSECLQWMILQGADLNSRDNQFGNSPLHWSIVNNFSDGVRLCLQYSQRIDVNSKNKSGESPLHLLVKYPDLHGFIGDLLDKGAEIDLRNSQQRTPLMIACEYGYIDAAKTLINRGSYIYHQDESGYTALGIAKKNGHTSLVTYLTDLGGGGFNPHHHHPSGAVTQKTEADEGETVPLTIDSWPSTDDEDDNGEDEEEIASKTRKFDPIIAQLKSLQKNIKNGRPLTDGSTSKTSQHDSAFDAAVSIEPSNQQKTYIGWESSDDSDSMRKMVKGKRKSKLKESDKESDAGDGYYDDDDEGGNRKRREQNSQENNGKMESSFPKSKELKRDLVSSMRTNSSKIGEPRLKEFSQEDPTLGHIDQVYSHGTSNDDFIKEIKNLLDEEIRENDELDALLFASASSPPPATRKNGISSKADEEEDENEADDDDKEGESLVNNSNKSNQTDNLSEPKTYRFEENSGKPSLSSSSLPTFKDSKLPSSASAIRVNILSDLWEEDKDEEDEPKFHESKKELHQNKLSPNGLANKKEIFNLTPTVESANDKEILGTFFLKNISDESDESESKSWKEEIPTKSVEPTVKEGSTAGLSKPEQTYQLSTQSVQIPQKSNQTSQSTPNQASIKKDSPSKSIKKSIISELTERFAGKLPFTPNLQAASAPPLPPPLPPQLPSSLVPPALPPRPQLVKLADELKMTERKEKSVDLASIEVQTELDEISCRLKEIERAKEEGEMKIKSLELEMCKQSKEAQDKMNELLEEINSMRVEKELLDKEVGEMKLVKESLAKEKSDLVEKKRLLERQVEYYQETCKCSDLQEELRKVKDQAKSRGNNEEFIRKLHDLNDECNDLRRELNREQSSLKEEIATLEKDKELFRLENRWLKEKLDEMRNQMKDSYSQRNEALTLEEKEILTELRKAVFAVDDLLRKLNDKLSGLDLKESKELMEKFIIEVAKNQINQQVETLFQEIRSLLADLQKELNAFRFSIDEHIKSEIKADSDKDKTEVKSDETESQRKIVPDHVHQTTPVDNRSSSPTKKIQSNGFAIFESRISQLTSSIEKLEDNIERQELNLLVRSRGQVWTALETREHEYLQSNNNMLINLLTDNANANNYQMTRVKPQSIFVQSLMKLQSPGTDQSTINRYHRPHHFTNYHMNCEPSSLSDFHYAKNSLQKQIVNLKTELGLTH